MMFNTYRSDISTIELNYSPFKVDINSKYVPYFAINKIPFNASLEYYYSYNKLYAKDVRVCDILNKFDIVNNYIHRKVFDNIINIGIDIDNKIDIQNIKNAINITLESISEWINSPIQIDLPCRRSHYYGGLTKYNELIKAFKEADKFNIVSLVSNSYYVGPFYISKRVSSTGGYHEHICMLMIKSEAIPYVRACIATNTEPDRSCFEFWVEETFDTKYTKHPGLRAKYRKEIKTLMRDNEIPIYEKSAEEFWKVFKFIKAPKLASITERKEFLSKISSEFMTHRKAVLESIVDDAIF